MPPPPKLFTKQGLFPGADIQVTHSTPKQSRSESVISINPTNVHNLISASKKFIDPLIYHFTIGVSYSFNGGSSWTESFLSPLQGSDGMTDPALAFDHLGNAFLVAEPWKYVTINGIKDLQGMGMYVYKSVDGGQNWTGPVVLHPDDKKDDKQWIVCDLNSTSPFYGNIYVCWAASAPLRFSRSTDHGNSWKGVGNTVSGTAITIETSFAPEITVGYDGVIHIVWHMPGSGEIRYLRSVDGGNSFGPVAIIVIGVSSLTGHLPFTNGWPHFNNATFRVLTLATGCAVEGNRFIVAWADYRENVSRIYYRITDTAGNWTGPVSGQPMLPNYQNNALHHFHPQIISTGNGIIGCAFYEFGLKQGGYRIDVKMATSFTVGASFDYVKKITDQPWDPKINAPLSHGDPKVTFIGEYFGLDASDNAFAINWTDTRTGVQELFFDWVNTEKFELPGKFKGIYAKIIFGVVQGGGGLIWVGGKPIPIPPHGPAFDIINALAALDSVMAIDHSSRLEVQRSLYASIESIAKTALKNLKTKDHH